MPLELVEILGRSDQGMTRPFICRATDGNVYFVKGRGAGRRSLVCEWVAGGLAASFGLPIAPFTLVDVPQQLIEISPRDDIADLGAGLAFGSKRIQITEFTISNLIKVPQQLQIDVVAFDRWIRNGDRNLSTHGGNPNLFWNVETQELVVLDHNQAFDEDFSIPHFSELHVFREAGHSVARDLVTQAQLEARFDQLLFEFDRICDTVPDEWWFIDAEQTIPVAFDRQQIQLMLTNSRGNEFWSFP